MEALSLIFDKYGAKIAIIVFLLKTIWDFFVGRTRKYIADLEANTLATRELTQKVNLISNDTSLIPKIKEDLNLAFYNIKEIRNRSNLGPLTKRDQ